MPCLVTGGAGFIGSNLVHRLVREGRPVRVVDDLSTGRRRNLDGLPSDVEFIGGDLNDPEVVRRSLAGVDTVFHLAAIPSVPRSVDDPIATYFANTHLTVRLLEACRQAKVRRLVFASSSSVYGDSPTLPKVETEYPNPISPYAASKVAGEFYCTTYWNTYRLETVVLRFFNVFGPRQNPASQYAAAIPLFIRHLLRGEPPTVFGDGEQSRDFTFVDDTLSAILLAAEAPGVAGRVMNVAGGRRITVNALIEVLNRILGTAIAPVYVAPRPGDIKHSVADISRARTVLGFAPKTDLEAGLRATLEWFRRAE